MFRRFGLCFPVLSGLKCFVFWQFVVIFFFFGSPNEKNQKTLFIFRLRSGFSQIVYTCWDFLFCSVRFVFRVTIFCFFSVCCQNRIIFCISISIWFLKNVGLHVLAFACLFYQVCRFLVFWHVVFFFFLTEETK
jgi:hypothetical protein